MGIFDSKTLQISYLNNGKWTEMDPCIIPRALFASTTFFIKSYILHLYLQLNLSYQILRMQENAPFDITFSKKIGRRTPLHPLSGAARFAR